MPDSIKIPREEDSLLPNYHANLIPCHIQHNGAANTNEYFTPSKIIHHDDKQTTTEAYFRGLKLVGESLHLLQMNYTGYLINKSECIERSNEPDHQFDESLDQLITVNTYNAIGKFDELIIYGHDSVVEPNCQWKLIDEWNQISNAIHE